MRINAGGAARPDYTDRNPIKRTGEGQNIAGAASLADTNLTTYTVPAGKKARVEFAWCMVEERNNVALSAGGRALTRMRYIPNGGSEVVPVFAILQVGQKGETKYEAAADSGVLLAGDVVTIGAVVEGANAGANVVLRGGFAIMEYDA